jgi:long-subunit acyl-CoA synthetase (AMP-forming)
MLVFRDIRQTMFGGHIRTLYVTLNDTPKKDIGSFYRAILGAQVIKVKCQPETSGCMVATLFYDYSVDLRLVGPPSACVQIKLKDAKRENYTAEDTPNPRGEILVRGNNVFLGYWDDEQNTLDKLNPDGWFTTGILGELLPNGSFLVLGYTNQQ